MNRLLSRGARLAIATVLLAALGQATFAGSGQAAPTAQGSVGLSPSSGPAGSSVTVSGSGWTASNPDYVIYWNSESGSQLGTFSVSDGSFSTGVSIPSGASAGAHQIVVCEGVGGEFKGCSSATFTVSVPPTNTPAPPTATFTPAPPTATFTPSLTFTPSQTLTPSITPTPVPCVQEIEQISPEHFERDFGGVETLDLVMRITMQGREESQLIVRMPDGREIYTQWPDPLPGTTVEAEPDSTRDNTWTITVRDYPVALGYNQILAEISPNCSGSTYRTERIYYQFRNGVAPTLTPRPDRCGGLGLGPEAEVMTFNRNGIGFLEEDHGVYFEGTGEIDRMDNQMVRSGYRALRSHYQAFEFGSIAQAIRMNFRPERRVVQAVGMFVGLDEVMGTTGDITAQLTVYGYSPGGEEMQLLGSTATSFPAEPTDIEHCLRFEAAEDEIIARAILDFVDSDGFSIVEDRWLDDLTMVYREGEMPPNAPPFIEIVAPEDGSVVVGDVHLRGEIVEDLGLAHVRYKVDDGEWTEVGFSPLIGEPDRYWSGVNLGLSYRSSHVLTMEAEDLAGQRWMDHITVNIATPIPTLDVEVVDLEVTQVIQCMGNTLCEDNSVPILAGKPTMVRVYLRATGGPPERAINGRLCRGAGTVCDSPYLRSINEVVPDEDENPIWNDRGDLDNTLNFILPPHWVSSPHPLEFTVHANYEGENVDETDFDNNRQSHTVDLQPARELNVVFVSMSNDGTTASLGARWDIVDWLARVYPITEVNTLVGVPNFIIGDYDLTDDSGDGCGRGWGRLMDILRDHYFWSGPGEAHWYGMVPGDTDTGAYAGCGERPGEVASGITTEDRGGGEVAAQEIGHNLGRRHAPGCGAANSDGDFPRSGGLLDAWGLDIGRSQLYSPSSSYDYMGYCGGEANTWTSAYTYRILMRELDVASAVSGSVGLAAQDPADYETFLVGSGYLSTTGFELEEGFFRVELPAGTNDRLPGGPYQVRLYGTESELLHERDFGFIELSKQDTTTEGHVLLALPAPEELEEIALLYSGTQIFSQQPSETPPEVTLLSPAGGDSWPREGSQRFEWQANDADGDELSFNLQYSQDGGASWKSLTSNLRGETSFEVEAAAFPGGSTQFRVLASDGLHTASSGISAPIQISPKPPQIHVALPEDGASYPAGEAVIFRGFAADLEDQPLEESAFRWSSDVDGEIGTGKNLWGQELSPGFHTISLTVTDSGGMSAEQSVRIEVLTRDQAAVESPPAQAFPSAAGLLVIAGLVMLGLAGLGAVIYAWRGDW